MLKSVDMCGLVHDVEPLFHLISFNTFQRKTSNACPCTQYNLLIIRDIFMQLYRNTVCTGSDGHAMYRAVLRYRYFVSELSLPSIYRLLGNKTSYAPVRYIT